MLELDRDTKRQTNKKKKIYLREYGRFKKKKEEKKEKNISKAEKLAFKVMVAVYVLLVYRFKLKS